METQRHSPREERVERWTLTVFRYYCMETQRHSPREERVERWTLTVFRYYCMETLRHSPREERVERWTLTVFRYYCMETQRHSPREERVERWTLTVFRYYCMETQRHSPREERVVRWNIPGSNDHGGDSKQLNHSSAEDTDLETAVHHRHSIVQSQRREVLHVGHFHHPVHQNISWKSNFHNILNRTRPRAPVQNQETRDLISIRKTSKVPATTSVIWGIYLHVRWVLPQATQVFVVCCLLDLRFISYMKWSLK